MDLIIAATPFTLMMIDPDVTTATVGTRRRPLVHWMIVNAPLNNVLSGDEIVSYMGPMPPNDETHYYYFLLFKQSQSGPINGTEMMKKLTGKNCTEQLRNR